MIQGDLRKLHTQLAKPVQYALPIGDDLLPLNERLGQTLSLTHTGSIHCVACGNPTPKSYQQGHCFPCTRRLASCDMCILKPEQCHYDKGTCREPSWGEAHCMRPHTVYLANSSGIKVGITRNTQIPTRWIDQGAIAALPIFQVDTRLHSGLLEVILAQSIADKTNWRRMLKGEVEDIDLKAESAHIIADHQQDIDALQKKLGDANLTRITDADMTHIEYPVLEYPTKITSLNFDKQPEITGTLLGIKGQYLIFDIGVLNIRKFSGYEIIAE